jgi:hypothetical protein
MQDPLGDDENGTGSEFDEVPVPVFVCAQDFLGDDENGTGSEFDEVPVPVFV